MSKHENSYLKITVWLGCPGKLYRLYVYIYTVYFYLYSQCYSYK